MRWPLLPCPEYTLVFSEAEYLRLLRAKRIKNPKWAWVSEGAQATTHTFNRAGRPELCVVCVDVAQLDNDGVVIAALLVHEAVHVWQQARDAIGEDAPGKEVEAYAIQAISQGLMADFARRVVQGGDGASG